MKKLFLSAALLVSCSMSAQISVNANTNMLAVSYERGIVGGLTYSAQGIGAQIGFTVENKYDRYYFKVVGGHSPFSEDYFHSFIMIHGGVKLGRKKDWVATINIARGVTPIGVGLTYIIK